MVKIKINWLLLIAFLSTFYILLATYIYADDCVSTCSDVGDCQEKIKQCQRAWDLMQAAKQPHEDALNKMEADIANFQKRIKQIEAELIIKAKEIKQSELDLDSQQDLLAKRVRQQYIKSYYNNALILIFSQKTASQVIKELIYQQAVANQDKNAIGDIVLYIKNLQNSQNELESEQLGLASLKTETDKRAAEVRKLVDEANAYQQKLVNIVSALNVKQQEILKGKSETFQTSVGEVPLADDAASSPNYNPGFSPAFAVFSFGAPHRKGMSQYGAYGRAKSGQSAEDILHAYYGSLEIKKDYATDIMIRVSGLGSWNIEDYAKRIYEVPNSWGDEGGFEALKAQAVAARSYALAYTNNGSGSICATESCQVFQTNPKGGKWEEAVNQTRGWVLVANGQPFSAWYAASSGGFNFAYSANNYSTPGGWDTKCGSRNCWTGDAYEKIAGSPWFYKAWYKERGGVTCGRSHPWLNMDEFSDILNAWVVFTKGSGDDRNHVTPTDTGCWGGDPYSISQMKDKANNLGGSYSNISSVSVEYSSEGSTSNVKLSTDRGEVSISGADFKTIFNLRAPGKISIKSGLFNVEKK